MEMLVLMLAVTALTSLADDAAVIYYPDQLAKSPLAIYGNPNAPCERAREGVMSCPDDSWSLLEDSQGGVCLWLSNLTAPHHTASDLCKAKGGNLLAIRSQARQETIQDFLQGVSEEVWTGAQKPAGEDVYHWPDNKTVTYKYKLEEGLLYEGEYADIQEEGYGYVMLDNICLRLKGDEERTWEESFCNSENLFVCDNQPECAANHFGPHCAGPCYCLGELCQGEQPCSAGCQAGWSGPHCCHKAGADVAYYCVMGDLNARYLVLRLDPKTTFYEALTLVDAEGFESRWCQYITVRHNRGTGIYYIHVPVNDRMPSSPCGQEQTGNNTYSWRVSLQQKRGFRLPLDRNLLLTCDFNHAENYTRQLQYSVQPDKQRASGAEPVEMVEPTRENVTLELIDPHTGEVIHQAALGTPVALRMRLLTQSGELRAQGVAPYYCKAKDPKGINGRRLTNVHGCPESSAVMSSLWGSNGTVTSDPFPLFAIPGQDSVTISCDFRFCFKESDPRDCEDSCGQSGGEGRVKREVWPHRHGSLSANILVLPRREYDSKQPDMQSSGSHRCCGHVTTTVMWFVAAVLLVLSSTRP